MKTIDKAISDQINYVSKNLRRSGLSTLGVLKVIKNCLDGKNCKFVGENVKWSSLVKPLIIKELNRLGIEHEETNGNLFLNKVGKIIYSPVTSTPHYPLIYFNDYTEKDIIRTYTNIRELNDN